MLSDHSETCRRHNEEEGWSQYRYQCVCERRPSSALWCEVCDLPWYKRYDGHWDGQLCHPDNVRDPKAFTTEIHMDSGETIIRCDACLARWVSPLGDGKLQHPDNDCPLRLKFRLEFRTPQSENEQLLLRQFSDALTGGCASTWDEVLRAAQSLNEELSIERKLRWEGEASAKRAIDKLIAEKKQAQDEAARARYGLSREDLEGGGTKSEQTEAARELTREQFDLMRSMDKPTAWVHGSYLSVWESHEALAQSARRVTQELVVERSRVKWLKDSLRERADRSERRVAEFRKFVESLLHLNLREAEEIRCYLNEMPKDGGNADGNS